MQASLSAVGATWDMPYEAILQCAFRMYVSFVIFAGLDGAQHLVAVLAGFVSIARPSTIGPVLVGSSSSGAGVGAGGGGGGGAALKGPRVGHPRRGMRRDPPP